MPRRAPLGVAVRATVAPPPVSSPSVGSSRSSQSDDGEPPVPDMTDTYRILAVLGAIYAADAMFLALGAPAACVVSPTVAAGAGVIASAAVVYASSLWDRFASSSSAAAAADAVIRAVDVARCLVAATGSVLALIIVEALRTSKAVTAATCAGSALVFVGAYFAKEMDKGLTVTVTKPGATAPDVPPTRVGMQGTPSDKELTRLEAIRQILLEEFMEEEARLAAAEENKKSEVLRLEAIYETRIKTLGREITILKNKNAELSVFAGKAASHDSLKQRAETEIATLKKTHDAEISALKAQISGLEATIADVEAKMAAERAAMAEQLRAARGQYTAQKALFDSEMRKYRAALSLAAQHTEWWKAESRRIERDAAEKRDALESWHAKQMSSKVESERKGAQATFERELASLRASHEAEMESAVAQALGERNALQTLMDERLEDAERRREADIISAVRAAVAEAETKVAAEWRLKVEKVEAINKNIAKTFAREAERQSAEAKRATDAERAALIKTHDAQRKAMAEAHARALDEAKLTAQNALAAAKRDALGQLEAQTEANAAELDAATRAVEKETEALRAALVRERDDAVAEAREQLAAARAERGALYALHVSEASKLEGIVRARLADELAEAERAFGEFWSGKIRRLQEAHDAKYAQLWKDRKKEVAGLKADLMAEAERVVADALERETATREGAAAERDAALAAQAAEYAAEKRATRRLMHSEAAKARARDAPPPPPSSTPRSRRNAARSAANDARFKRSRRRKRRRRERG